MCLRSLSVWGNDGMSEFNLATAPFLPFWALVALGAVALVLGAIGIFLRQRGAALRLLGSALLLAALTNPSLVKLDRDKLNDVVAVVVDRSGSQALDGRMAQTERARMAILDQLKLRPGTDVRVIDIDEGSGEQDGTRLFEGMQSSLADVAPERLSGVVAITDGRVHDAPAQMRALGITAPMHALVTGRVNERDRRIEIVEGPRFGIVGKDSNISLRVLDAGAAGGQPATLTVKRSGQVIQRRPVQPGQLVRLPIRIENAGANFFEIEVNPLPDELTLLNNMVVLTVEGVRDKLKVLLVSGEPHAGERTWRNLLKADGNVDLVHFTILRPPEKQDGTPINELALIAFPTRELFIQKIAEFDLLIFDRYANLSLLPSTYFDNIARYVRNGGAVLVAAGWEFSGPGSLFRTPLSTVLPARPTGQLVERPFLPLVSQLGERHPVTRNLPGWKKGAEPDWAPWFRLVNVQSLAGQNIMSGPDDAPLLVLNRVEKGRIAMLLSDHAWVWARGMGEGGPYIDLLRRLSHWLMKEPELDEEALRLSVRGRQLTLERQTLSERTRDLRLIGPDGEERVLTPAEEEPGLWRVRVTAQRNGIHRLTDGERVAFANVGPANPREFRDVTSTTDILQPLLEQGGGGARRLDAGGGFQVPRIVDIRSGSRFSGNDFIGLRPNEAFVVKGADLTPLALGGLGLLALLAGIILPWLREGRSRSAAR
jgi:uncharacterized membrane protein